jgi:general secretion pathway protein A
MKNKVVLMSLLVVLVVVGLHPSSVDANQELVETGRLLAILLDSGRVTVGSVQALINDPDKGDKGFTPEVFGRKLLTKFKERSGVDLKNLQDEKVPPMAKKLLPVLVEASKKTVATYQPIINKQGMGFKNFIPATFGTHAAAIFTARTGSYLKQTTFDELLRNPKNKADEFEAATLKKFAETAYPRVGEKVISANVDGGKMVRIMLPLFYGKGCLACHGEPKGERDISGYIKEGGKEGDLGGAISVKLAVN